MNIAKFLEFPRKSPTSRPRAQMYSETNEIIDVLGGHFGPGREFSRNREKLLILADSANIRDFNDFWEMFDTYRRPVAGSDRHGGIYLYTYLKKMNK